MTDFRKFDALSEDLAHGVHNFSVDDLHAVFVTAEPHRSMRHYGDLAELEPGGGYDAGGLPVTVKYSQQENGRYELRVDDLPITPAAPVGPFRYVALVNFDKPYGPLVGWWRLDAPVTIPAGVQFILEWGDDGLVLVVDVDAL